MSPREAGLTAALAASQQENARLRQEVVLLQQKIDALVRRIFGSKSEQLNPAQLELLLTGNEDLLPPPPPGNTADLHTADLPGNLHVLAIAPGPALRIVTSGANPGTYVTTGTYPSNLAAGQWHHVVFSGASGGACKLLLMDLKSAIHRCWDQEILVPPRSSLED